ncbi:MAG: hypothetical protein NTW66_00220 [Candidatus Magasanikbacteria bacterium]|nr:hypothetical protein [Candidatus Magasanikbacteria bacterium]
MPQDLLKQDVNFGNVVYSWSFREYEKFNRGKRWYWITGLLAALLIAYAVYTANYLFALIIVLFGIIIFLQDMNEPAELDFALTDTGIVVGTKYYPFSELEKYWIVYNPPMVKVLYFEPKSTLKHRLHIPLLDTDPLTLRDYLNQFLIEDLEKEDEPLSDRLGRMFKIQ